MAFSSPLRPVARNDLHGVEAFGARRSANPGGPARAGDNRNGGIAGGSRRTKLSQPLLIAILLIFDIGAILLSGGLAYAFSADSIGSAFYPLACACGVVLAAALTVLKSRWAYTIRAVSDFPRQSVSLALALAFGLIVWCALAAMTGFADNHGDLLRLWTLRWFAWGWAIGVVGRAFFAASVMRWTRQGLLARRTIVVGGGDQALETLERLERSGGGALEILGLFDDRNRTRLPVGVDKYHLLGVFDDLEAFCREADVDLLIVALPLSAETRILQIMQKLLTLPVDVRISALGSKLKLRDRAYHYIGDVPFLPIFDKPLSDWSHALKSVFDRIVATLAIVLLSPLLALLALGVKLSSPGPVFFVQKRYGFNNQEFQVFKFRSMYADKCDPAAAKLVTRGDMRVTAFGAFIRRTSLDELPQLFNVLRGELSLVGPRPHALKGKAAGLVYENVVDHYFARHRVKPGITGWAQINGWRGETDTVEKIEKRVAHDLYYIENWSLWLDVKILVMTPISVLVGKNAF
jgi:Undecaprenyl-phosphate glucose phosphotransferase